jgi:aryl-alcohol dehydrogenase-like predicted oxidoreductase
MKYSVLGKTGWEVSAVGMGCWGIAGQWGPVEEKEAITTMQRAIDLGVNLFDTADAYGTEMGTSEELVGHALVSYRKDVFIATKVGNWARRFGHPLPYTHPLHITGCCDASLYRLKTDYIDIYQCHISGLEEPGIFLEAFEGLVQAGKVRAYGISTDSLNVLQQFNRDGNCAVCQLNYSTLRRDAELALLPYCQENNIGTLIRGPLAQGILTGKFTPEATFTDWVREDWNVGEARERFLRNLQIVDKLGFLENETRNMAQAALQFVLAHPGVTCPIPGAKNVAQVEANAAAAAGELSDDELQRINQIFGHCEE